MYCINNTPFANLKYTKSLKYLAELDEQKESRIKRILGKNTIQPTYLRGDDQRQRQRQSQSQRQSQDNDIDKDSNTREIEDRGEGIHDVLIEKFMIFVFDDE